MATAGNSEKKHWRKATTNIRAVTAVGKLAEQRKSVVEVFNTRIVQIAEEHKEADDDHDDSEDSASDEENDSRKDSKRTLDSFECDEKTEACDGYSDDEGESRLAYRCSQQDRQQYDVYGGEWEDEDVVMKRASHTGHLNQLSTTDVLRPRRVYEERRAAERNKARKATLDPRVAKLLEPGEDGADMDARFREFHRDLLVVPKMKHLAKELLKGLKALDQEAQEGVCALLQKMFLCIVGSAWKMVQGSLDDQQSLESQRQKADEIARSAKAMQVKFMKEAKYLRDRQQQLRWDENADAKLPEIQQSDHMADLDSQTRTLVTMCVEEQLKGIFGAQMEAEKEKTRKEAEAQAAIWNTKCETIREKLDVAEQKADSAERDLQKVLLWSITSGGGNPYKPDGTIRSGRNSAEPQESTQKSGLAPKQQQERVLDNLLETVSSLLTAQHPGKKEIKPVEIKSALAKIGSENDADEVLFVDADGETVKFKKNPRGKLDFYVNGALQVSNLSSCELRGQNLHFNGRCSSSGFICTRHTQPLRFEDAGAVLALYGKAGGTAGVRLPGAAGVQLPGGDRSLVGSEHSHVDLVVKPSGAFSRWKKAFSLVSSLPKGDIQSVSGEKVEDVKDAEPANVDNVARPETCPEIPAGDLPSVDGTELCRRPTKRHTTSRVSFERKLPPPLMREESLEKFPLGDVRPRCAEFDLSTDDESISPLSASSPRKGQLRFRSSVLSSGRAGIGWRKSDAIIPHDGKVLLGLGTAVDRELDLRAQADGEQQMCEALGNTTSRPSTHDPMQAYPSCRLTSGSLPEETRSPRAKFSLHPYPSAQSRRPDNHGLYSRNIWRWMDR